MNDVLRQDFIQRLKDGEVFDKAKFVEESVSELRRFSEGKGRQPKDEQIQKARESAGRIFDEVVEQDRHLKEVQEKLNSDELDLKFVEKAKEIGEKEINLVASLKEQLNVREAEIEKIREFSQEVYQDNLNRLQSLRTRLSEVFKRSGAEVEKVNAGKKDVVPPPPVATPVAEPTPVEKPKEEKQPVPASTPARAEPERPRPSTEVPPTEPPTSEKQKVENIDLPSALLAEILGGREKELHRFMELIYRRALTEERGERVKIYLSDALQELFAKKPDEKIMSELRKHGIEDWQDFCALLKGPVGDNVNRVMNKMAQEQIQCDVAKNTKWYENIWAIKGQMTARILTNITLVGGGVALASFAATGIGGAVLGIGAAAIGGGAGGFIRGLLQKHVFGTKKMEEKKKEKLQALAKRKQEELTGRLLENNFSETSNWETTNKETAAILAQVFREASVVEKSGEASASVNLDANAKRQYLDALRAIKNESGIEPNERAKIELVEVLSALQSKSEQKQAEAIKNSDPAVVRILDGVMRGYTGTHEKAGIVSTSVIGAGVGAVLADSSYWGRGAMGAIGGGLTGYQMAEKGRTRKEEEKALKEIQIELKSAHDNLEFLIKETVPDLQNDFSEKLNFYVRKFRVAMRGGGEEAYASALKNNPILRTQVENLIYESDKAIAVVEAEQRKKMSALLEALEKEGEAVVKEVEKKSKFGRWWAKNIGSMEFHGIKTKQNIKDTLSSVTLGRFSGIVFGAGIGAGVAIIAGEGIKEWRHILFGYHAPCIEPPHFDTKATHHVEPVAPKPEPIEPTPAPKARPIVEPVAVKSAAVAVTVAATEVAPASRHTGDFDFANPENDQTTVDFAKGHNVTTNEFAYLKDLTKLFPELNSKATVGKILDSAEFHDGKHSLHPEIYKSTINTPIEAAADSRFATFDAILRAGGIKRAIEFLKLQDFNEHDLRGNLKLTGSLDGQNLDNKLGDLVKAYQGGDNKSGKDIFNAFRHDQERVIAHYEDAKGIAHIKGVGGHNPRVLGVGLDGKLLVGQAKGYGATHIEAHVPAPAPTTAPAIEPVEGVKEYVPAQKGGMWGDAEMDRPKVAVEVNEQTADLIKARAGDAAHFQETFKQPNGHVIEYHYDADAGEVTAYDLTADLAAQASVDAGAGDLAAVSAIDHALSSHAPRPIPISELWGPSKGGGGGGSGGSGGSGASGGGGVVEEPVIKKVGGGGTAVESHKTQGGVAEQEKQLQQSAMAEANVKKFGESQTDIVAEAPIVKQEYVQTLSDVRNELEDKLSGLIIDDSTMRRQGTEIVYLFDKEMSSATAGSKVDSSLLDIVKENFGVNRVDMYNKVMSGLSDKLSLEQELLFKGVPETFTKIDDVLAGAAVDAPTHLLKYHLDDGWHAVYDERFLYSMAGKKLQIFDAQTGEPFEGQWKPPYRK